MRNKLFLLSLAVFLLRSVASAQLPVEIFAGHEKATLDIMFFRYFGKPPADAAPRSSRWLFFSRTRAVADYRMTESAYLPQFGCTEAVSWNHTRLKGFAPVFVGQILNRGVFPKAGIQYALLRKRFTLFTWLVCETLKNPDLDYFILFRYTPPLTGKLNLFTQVESLNTFPGTASGLYSFTQRIRLGLHAGSYQFGTGADLNQSGSRNYTFTLNAGIFLRHEF